MSDKAKRFELEKGLYAVDTRSGHGDSPSGISGVADRIHKEIEESFNPDAVRRVDVDKMTKMGEGPAEIRGPITFPDYTCYIYRQNLYIRQNGRDELYVYGVCNQIVDIDEAPERVRDAVLRRDETSSVDRLSEAMDGVYELEQAGRQERLQMHATLGAFASGNPAAAKYYLQQATFGNHGSIQRAFEDLIELITKLDEEGK
jgi:hypothetical protein